MRGGLGVMGEGGGKSGRVSAVATEATVLAAAGATAFQGDAGGWDQWSWRRGGGGPAGGGGQGKGGGGGGGGCSEGAPPAVAAAAAWQELAVAQAVKIFGPSRQNGSKTQDW